MTASARVSAQAKINLLLQILGREASGYHAIETVFARLDLADDVLVRLTNGPRSIDCRGADTGPPESNLAYRAAVAYAEAAGWPRGFAIEIDKRIPVGGGLGGGSADAGAVLRALDALAPRPLPEMRLLDLAAALGSDVPFLTQRAPVALGWGRGERLLALPTLPPADVGLVRFPFGVSSAEAYGWIAATRGAAPGPVRPQMLSLESLSSWEAVARIAANDFEAEVGRHHPVITEVLQHLRDDGVAIAQLCGSGSTVFVIDDAVARRAAPALSRGTMLTLTRTATSVEDVALIA
jgi:4-diphosphocytidyl-2-C-methyl-D-erythritol kinase